MTHRDYYNDCVVWILKKSNEVIMSYVRHIEMIKKLMDADQSTFNQITEELRKFTPEQVLLTNFIDNDMADAVEQINFEKKVAGHHLQTEYIIRTSRFLIENLNNLIITLEKNMEKQKTILSLSTIQE
jgi:hypothetical protein